MSGECDHCGEHAVDCECHRKKLKIDCISDLHGELPKLEGGDLLIVAGDITACDRVAEWKQFFDWLKPQEYRKKILVGGNHDRFLQQCISTAEAKEMKILENEGFDYLCDSGTEFEGLKIWGAPWTKNFYGQNPMCMAFGLKLETQMKEKWRQVPYNIDILVTHSPPKGILDQTWRYRCGCEELRMALENIRPRLHVFGHIHEGHGHIPFMQDYPRTQFVNAAIMNEVYDPVNKPITVNL